MTGPAGGTEPAGDGAGRGGDRPPAAPHRTRTVRWILVGALAAIAATAAVCEWFAARERVAGADDEPVATDVEPARREASDRLLAIERTCADLAESALARTSELTDPAEIFTRLEGLALPASAGLQVEDRDGNVIAWNGATIDDLALGALPFTGDGAVIVDTPASRRLAVRRTRTSPRDGAPVRAICHLPFEVRYPLRNRFFSSWSLGDDVRRRHRVGSCDVLLPAAASGTPLASAFGGEFARIDVTPVSVRAWNEGVDGELVKLRKSLLVAAILAAGALAAWEARRLAARRPATAALTAAATFAVLRTAVATVAMSDVLPRTAATDPRRYAHGLPLAFAASPLDLLLTALAALAIAAALRRAAQCSRVRATSPWPGAAAALAVALACGVALRGLVEDVVANSTVEFFTDVSVLPYPASAALVGALVAAGIATVLVIAAAWTWLGPASDPGRGPLVALACAVSLAAVPWGPAGSAADTLLVAAGTIGCAGAVGCLLLDAGTAARAAVVPLGVAVALFLPLERNLAASIRAAVETQAAERMGETDATARLLVEDTLDRIVASDELDQGLARGEVRRDLQLRLWAESPLASRAGGSSIEIEPRDPRIAPARFSVNLPPTPWLPHPRPAIGTVSPSPLPGRGPGRDGRWIVGSRRILAGDAVVATVWVTLEVRSPSNPGLPELEILGPAAESDTLRAPPLAVTRYDGSGRVTSAETNDAYRPAGASVLAEDLRERALGERGPVWSLVAVADRDLSVVVLPRMEGDAASAFYAFSYATGGVRRVAIRGARAVLCGALLAAVALAGTARRWARGPRLSLASRLVVSYVIVSGLPLFLLGWANFALARQRAEEATLRELREAVSLIGGVLEEPGTHDEPLRIFERTGPAREEWLRETAYGAGHHVNVFRGPTGALLASSDQGLFDTDLLPRRLPGPVFREIQLRGRPFHAFPARVGDEIFDVGYAPLHTPDGEITGALAVPLLHQRRLRETDLADGLTAILALYLASLVAAVGVGTWLASRLTRPLRDLTVATHRVAAGDLARPVPEAGPGELGEVVGAFNRMMRDLAESRERLVRAEKEAAWRDMARQVAHEVKNPLTPMRLAAEHLRRAWRDRVPTFGDVLERGVDMIVRQTESLQRIATAFSDFARLPGRRRDPTHLGEIVRRVVDLYASTPRLKVEVDVEDGLPAVLADPDEMQRVLVNLAKNAVEAMDGRDGTLRVALRRDGDHLRLDVADDGPGIPADVLPRLFEPYFSTKTSGTGLGLAICRRAIEDLGGTIAVRSAAESGTTVTVRVPVSTRPAA